MTQHSPAQVRPVILCGGSGTRLWPASRETFPKQFAHIIGARSTFQETILRVKEASLFGRPLVVTNHAHRNLVEQQLAEIGAEADVLLEPMARDSGPAIIAASLFVEGHNPSDLALILAADHLVRDVPSFHASVRAGLDAASSGRIVTFGIVPTHPAIGYGYIAPGAAAEGAARVVERFVEKPDAPTAEVYISKGYLWNSGNFLFSPATVIAEYARHDPESVETVRAAIKGGALQGSALMLSGEDFQKARKISFDFAVMEKTQASAVVPGSFGWSDIGGWDALWDLAEKDADGNAARGEAFFIDSSDTYVASEGQLVTTLGVHDIVVVATRDAVMVADKARAAEVKNIVSILKAKERAEASRGTRVFSAWGWEKLLESSPRCVVEHRMVQAGSHIPTLETQISEHWVVVRGEIQVETNGKAEMLTLDQSISIPAGAVRTVRNLSDGDAEFIAIAMPAG